MRRALLVVAALLLAGCAPPGGSRVHARSGPPTGSAPPSTGAPAPAAHVFVIVMENRSFAEAMAQPYTAGLAATYAVATDYHAVAHPSLPNYLALTSGSTHGITDDGYHRLPAGGIGNELTARRIPWRAYMEGMTAGCLQPGVRYAIKHNPFAYYGGGCPSNVVPLTDLARDLAGRTPNFVWITPDLCHDGHDCTSREADDFLAGLVPAILRSPAWQHGGLLVVTWDEDDGDGGNRVPAIVVAPDLTRHTTSRPYDHYSLLATVEDRLGVPRLGEAATADPLTDLFG
ncbi:MAG TPA: alkaline phosphatase family protein [Candidatus Dormibacteraeota bacterium]|nr:alkaline phosphatase family protein [Candidatus Dormibacteraeota bacterium]